MKRRVVLTPEADAELEQAFLFIREQSPSNAADWYNACLETIASLAEFPLRHPVAPESPLFPVEVRQMVFGSYRILYTVTRESVFVLHVRHCARDELGREDE